MKDNKPGHRKNRERRAPIALTGALLAVVVACGGAASKTDAGSHKPAPTARGTAIGDPATGTLTSDGGSLSSPDGVLTVTVPAGALAADTAISIQPITGELAGAVGGAYRLAPDGLTFAAPVQLTFNFTDDDVRGSAAALLDLAVQDAAGYWHPLADTAVDEAGHRITATTMHFSDYSRVGGLQLDPLEKTIRVGQSVTITGRVCGRVESNDVVDLVFDCGGGDDLAALNQLKDWSVNGAPGGVTAFGTVTATGPLGAVYRAPATQPSPNLMAVSATVKTRGGGSVTVVSNIRVVGTSTWSGTSLHTSSTVSLGKANATVTWEVVTEQDGHIGLAPVGSVAIDLSGVSDDQGCTISVSPSTVPITHDHGDLEIDTTTSPMTFFAAGNTFFDAIATYVCPDDTTSGPTLWSAPWLSASGEVSADGNTIEGTATDPFGTSVFSFTRD